MVQDSTTYYVWIGGSCDYGHKERAGGAAVMIEHNGSIISRDVISDLHTKDLPSSPTCYLLCRKNSPATIFLSAFNVLLLNQLVK